MTTPSELLELAEELAHDGREAAFRAAASRAYYAAFWHLRRVVEERLGSIDATGPEVHREVHRATQLWDEAAANRLSYLRSLRNLADYAPERTFTARAAAECVQAAQKILAMR